MSTWYQYDITVYGSPVSLGKFFNIDPSDIHNLDHFDFSFGQKNGAGMRYEKIIMQNTDLIFLVQQSIESDTFNCWIEGFVKNTNTIQSILVESSCGSSYEVNKRLLIEYEKTFPHLANLKNMQYDWKMFFNMRNAPEYLRYAEAFKDMVYPMSEEDMVFDNQPMDEE